MKSQISPSRSFIECSCSSQEHVFVFDYDKGYELISVGFRYNRLSLWHRLKECFNYLFKKDELCIEQIVIHSEDIKQLEEMIVDIKIERAERLKRGFGSLPKG